MSKPRIYSCKEHGLSSDMMDHSAVLITRTLLEAGHVAYLVGGCIRDLCMKKNPKDFDISTSARPEEVKKLFKRCFLIGKRFRLSIVRMHEKKIEVSTFRRGDLEDDSLITSDNVWGDEKDDVMRRDFTINGLLYDTINETIIDYVSGYQDTKNRLLKTIGNPWIKFKQDPVRMIRFLKFHARFQMNLDEDAILALKECYTDILKSSKDRLLEEFLRMLESGASMRFISLLRKFNFLKLLFPKIEDFLNKKGDVIDPYLNNTDNIINSRSNIAIPRPLLICNLIFPIIDLHILHKSKKMRMHMGHIEDEVTSKVKQIFHYFFKTPKKIITIIIPILVNQYRFVPLYKSNKPIKISPMKHFKLALDFFKLRSMIDAKHEKTFKNWHDSWHKFMNERRVN